MKRQQQQLNRLLPIIVRLHQLYKEQAKQDKGFAMVMAIAMMLTVLALLPAYLLMSSLERSTTFYNATSNSGFYAAESALNIRAEAIRQKFVGYNVPIGASPTSPGTSSTNTSQINIDACVNNVPGSSPGSGDFACQNINFKLNNSNIDAKTNTYVLENPNNLGTYPPIVTIPPGETFEGLKAQEYLYRVFSFASRANESSPMAILQMDFKSRLIPLFQFAAFYNNDLDFYVPPIMTFNGPIHTNNDLYLDSSGTLTINGQVSTGGKLYRGSKYVNNCTGSVTIFNPSTGTFLPLYCNGTSRTLYAQSGVSTSTTQTGVTAWGKKIQIGVKPLTLPAPDSLDPTPGKTYWDNADLRIVLTVDGSGTPIRDTNGNFIHVRNKDNTENTTATNNLLKTCPMTSPNPNTTLTSASANSSAILNVNSKSSFQIGDIVQIGTESDSHVISSIGGTSSPYKITLKRALGGGVRSSSEPSTVAPQYNPPSTTTPNTVSKAIVSTSDTFYNYREKKNVGLKQDDGTYIRMLNVDIQGLLNCIQTQSLAGIHLDDSTNGGLVFYFTVEGPNSTTNVNSGGRSNNYGVRVYNGATLASTVAGAPAIKGLTIVSDQAVYIRGDYNALSTKTQAQNLASEKPASFLADTINVLSNGWEMDDSSGRSYVSNLPSGSVYLSNSARAGTSTAIDAAFLAGTTITGNANGTSSQGGGLSTLSGGVNNYPRFHENWNGATLQYTGSFVSLNTPRRTNSPYCGSMITDVLSVTDPATQTNCWIYYPPTRNWNYDTNFNNAALLPPLTPRAVYLRQEGFSRTFSR